MTGRESKPRWVTFTGSVSSTAHINQPHAAAAATAAGSKVRERRVPWVFPTGPSCLCTPWVGRGGLKPQPLTLRGAGPSVSISRKEGTPGQVPKDKWAEQGTQPEAWATFLAPCLFGCFRNCLQSRWVLARAVPWLPKLCPAWHQPHPLNADERISFPEG